MQVFKTTIVGMQYMDNILFDDVAEISSREISLEPEPTNPYDSGAVKFLSGSKHIGYISRDDSAAISKELQKGTKYSVDVLSRNMHTIRVLIKMDIEDSPEAKNIKRFREKLCEAAENRNFNLSKEIEQDFLKNITAAPILQTH